VLKKVSSIESAKGSLKRMANGDLKSEEERYRACGHIRKKQESQDTKRRQ
jgi:hypothetical protein